MSYVLHVCECYLHVVMPNVILLPAQFIVRDTCTVAGSVYTRMYAFVIGLQVYDKSPLRIKNVGIWLRYDSRSGTHNMYREYRDLTIAAAVTQCCECLFQILFCCVAVGFSITIHAHVCISLS